MKQELKRKILNLFWYVPESDGHEKQVEISSRKLDIEVCSQGRDLGISTHIRGN